MMKHFLMNRKKMISQQPSTFAEMTANYWSISLDQVLKELNASVEGLQANDASARLSKYGLNTIRVKQQNSIGRIMLNQIKSPLVLILIFAAIISGIVGEWVDALIVLVVVAGSTILGFSQEYSASVAIDKLRKQVTIKSNILRDGKSTILPSENVVPGDVVLLSAGSLIPADGIVLEANDFFVNQAVLTGETFPVEKKPGIVSENASLAERTNCVFMGTNVRSGIARVFIVQTGKETIFGQVAERLVSTPPETEFEHGLHEFGTLLTQIMMVMVISILALNFFMNKPFFDSLLFALALAVGISPELLPAITSITLSHGAKKMNEHGVIVRRLNAIEDFGNMDVLCTDKTGTLTEGVVHLDNALDIFGNSSKDVLRYAMINAHFQTGLDNPLDEAIQQAAQDAGIDIQDEQKISEIPYDFVRKSLSIVAENKQRQRFLITKGAMDRILPACESVQFGSDTIPLDAATRDSIEKKFGDWSEEGFRVLGLAIKEVEKQTDSYTYKDEHAMTLIGFLLFLDPPKTDVEQTIEELKKRNVQIKIITGDNAKVAKHVANHLHIPVQNIITGSDLNKQNDQVLWHLAESATIFAEMDPNQKERIIHALRKTGHVVGYMGDGINDAPALRSADIGISVDTAVDVAKDAADFVLLRKDLSILQKGIDEGRKTYANTLKYILTTISANFGNMISMAGISVYLPFLPLLASQILLNNFLSDFPGLTIASDNVDYEMIEKPNHWNTRFIRNYMILFGLTSSIFDFLTFGVLLFFFHAQPDEFRTGWFIESLLTELVIALVVRTRRPFFHSRPGNLLLASSLFFIGLTLVIPYIPFLKIFRFVPLPIPLLMALIGLTMVYVLATESVKKLFFTKIAKQ
ncbi:magnesium-translocating P-type ATPase [Flexilinea flocculi]|nr:magnesium-translocating P-type ATPase [Flexilinea flocculi]